MKYILSFILFINYSFAQVAVLRKGEVVPFDGVLFTKELEKEIRTNLDISDKKISKLEGLNKLNDQEIDILNKRLNLYQQKSLELSDKAAKLEEGNFYKSFSYFLAGALLTGFIGYGVVKNYR